MVGLYNIVTNNKWDSQKEEGLDIFGKETGGSSHLPVAPGPPPGFRDWSGSPLRWHPS